MTDAAYIAIFGFLSMLTAQITQIVLSRSAHRQSTASLDHITVLTNSTLSAAMKRIDELELEVKAMRESAHGDVA